MLLKKGAEDEILILSELGLQIDIAKLIDHINGNREIFEVVECETENLLNLGRTDGIDWESVRKIDNMRINQPILVAHIQSHKFVIDGNHRLLKRHDKKIKKTRYIPIPREVLELFSSNFSLYE